MHRLVAWPELRARFLVRLGDMTRRMHTKRQRRLLQLLGGAMVEIDELAKAHRVAADDGKRHRQFVLHRAHHRFRAAADADPCLERAVLDLRIDDLVLEARMDRAFPGHRALLEQRREEIELFGKKALVVAERIAEERERFGERAAPEDHSARPLEIASIVEKRWNTRMGSSELSTVTAEPRWMRECAKRSPPAPRPAPRRRSRRDGARRRR